MFTPTIRRVLPIIALVSSATIGLAPDSVEIADASPASAYIPTAPARLADTREPACGCWRLDDRTIRVSIAGRAGVPRDSTAAHLTITVTDISATLHVTAWPSGSAIPNSSVLNAAPADVATATSIPIALGTGGAIDVMVSRDASVVIDVAGAWVPADSGRRGGRYRPMSSTLTTLTLAAGAPVEMPAPQVANARALVLAIAVESTLVPGFVAAWPGGMTWPGTSVLNHRGMRRRATTIVPTGGSSSIQLMSSTDATVTIEVIGAIVEATGPDGLFVPSVPTRVLDTRFDLGLPWASTGQMPASGSVIRHLSGVTGGTVVSVLTTVGGSVGAVTSTSSSIVHRRDGSAAHADVAYTPVGSNGSIGYVLEGATHLVTDVMGYFTGPTPPPSPPTELAMLPARPWEPARRSGTPCETRLLEHLDRHMPTQSRWVLPYIEVQVSRSLPVAGNAAFANFGYLHPRNSVVPSVGPVSGPMTMLVRDSACNGGARERYLATHEAIGHLLDSLFDDIDGWPRSGGRHTGFSFNGISPMMPVFLTTPAQRAVELFADCATAVLGTAVDPHYTSCPHRTWRDETAVVLGSDSLHLRALPVQCAVHQVLGASMPFESTVLGGRIATGEAPTMVPRGSTVSVCTVAMVTPFGTLWGTTDNVVVLATPDGSLYRPVMTGSMAAYG